MAHRIHICICVAVGINRDASTISVLSESPSTGSASTKLYVCSRLLDLDFGQHSLLSKESKVGQIII